MSIVQANPLCDFDRYLYRRIGTKYRNRGKTLAEVQAMAAMISEWCEGRYSRKTIEWDGVVFTEGMVYDFKEEVSLMPDREDSPYGLPGDSLLIWRCFIVDDPVMGVYEYVYCCILEDFEWSDQVRVRHVFPMCLSGYWPVIDKCVSYRGLIDVSKLEVE